VSIHTRLVGAIDGIVMTLTAAMNIALLFVLFSPHAPTASDGLAEQYSVTIEQLS
jgi:hypothetical protein